MKFNTTNSKAFLYDVLIHYYKQTDTQKLTKKVKVQAKSVLKVFICSQNLKRNVNQIFGMIILLTKNS